MGILDAGRLQPTPAQGAHRCRMVLRGAVDSAEMALKQVNEIIDRHGREEIAAALGDADDADMITTCNELKAFAQKFGRTAPELKARNKAR